jgi:cell division protein ZapA
MGQIGVTINGRNYTIACDDGQEDRLHELATRVEERVGQLVAASGQIGDTRLLVMANLLFADELADTIRELDHLRAENERLQAVEKTVDPEALSDAIDSVARRLEEVAGRLEHT